MSQKYKKYSEGVAPVVVGEELKDMMCVGIGSKGDGIFKIQEFVIIVPGTVEGQTYDIEIVNMTSDDRYAFGKTI